MLRATVPLITRVVVRGFFQPVEVDGSALALPAGGATPALSAIGLSLGSGVPSDGSAAGSTGSAPGGSASAVLPGSTGLTQLTWRLLVASDAPIPSEIDPTVPTPPG